MISDPENNKVDEPIDFKSSHFPCVPKENQIDHEKISRTFATPNQNSDTNC